MLSQGPIDVRSSRPPVKEDGVDRDKRRQSAEKQKSAKDSEKKNEKTKNLDRQALEARRAKSRQRGEPEEESPSEDDGGDGDDDSEGMASRLERILEGPPRSDFDVPRMGAPKEGPSRSHRPRADTPPAPAQSWVVPHPQPPPAPKAGGRAKPQATGPLTRGRAAASGKGETSRRSASPGARQWEMLNQGLRPLMRGLEPRRGAVRGLPVEAPAGRPFSLWGKVFDAVILIHLFLCVFSRNGLLFLG